MSETADAPTTDTGRRMAAPSLDAGTSGDDLVLRLSGDWLARTVGGVESAIGDAAKGEAGRGVALDLSGINRIDTSGALLVERVARDLKADGRAVRIDGIEPRDEALFAAVRRAMDREPPPAKSAKGSPVMDAVAGLGESVVAMGREMVGAVGILGGTVDGAVRRVTGRTRFRGPAIISQIDRMGLRAVPIIAMMSFLVGAILAQQGAFQLRRFGGELYAVNLIGILVLRELGVLLTAIMVAGRSGSAITAEIGSMKMREEVDALHVIGLDPVGVLVFPRMVALLIALPLLTVVSNLAAIAGGMFALSLYSGITPASFLQGLQSSLDLFTVFSGLIKAPVMAVVIAIVACSEGMKVGGSAESLGLHVTSSVVKAIFLVILMDGFFAIFYASLGL
jgi:phospholipid/cholesterol/gamma-HCH transport system permease protein